MGGKSSSRSSTSTKTTYETTDNRGYVETGGVGVSGSSGVNIESVDAEALGVVLDYARDVGMFAEEALKETTQQSLGILAEAKEDNAKEITKWLLGTTGLLAAFWIWKAR